MEKERFSAVQRFWRLLKPDEREIRNVYFFAIFNGAIGLSLPLGIQAIVGFIQGGQVSTSWIMLVVFVTLGVAATGILQIVQMRITENLQQKIFARAAFEFAYRIPRIKMESLYAKYAPELMNRYFDISTVQKGLSKILIDFSSAGLQVFFGLLLLSFYHPFFIIFSVFLVVLIYVIFKFTAERGLYTSHEESTNKYAIGHWLEELGRSALSFKLAGSPSYPLERTDQMVDSYLDSREKHFSVLIGQYKFLVAFKVFVALGLLALGGILVMEGILNIGQFIAAEIVILLIMSSVEKLILSLDTIYDVLTALTKISQVTDLELESHEGRNLLETKENDGIAVKIQNLNFSYPGRDKIILNKLSMEIDSGQKVVVCGPRASGKHTLLKLISGLYDDYEGQLKFNGMPRKAMDLANLRAEIGDNLSDQKIFEGSIIDNITLGREGITYADVMEVCTGLGIDPFIQDLPNAYDATLEPEGINLPKSIYHKIILARAIVGKPKMLLVDDYIDFHSENERELVFEYLFNPKQNWTLILATDSIEAKNRADITYYLDKGSISDKVTKK